MVRSEGNMSLKNPVTPPGIDPGTVRLVTQRLNHYPTPRPKPDGTVHFVISAIEMAICELYIQNSKENIIFAELDLTQAKRSAFCPSNHLLSFAPSFRPLWPFLLEAYIPFSAFSSFLILHFNISLANSLCRLYTPRFPRYANM
jgi:hypothetical protein